jgi:hypothetical protein
MQENHKMLSVDHDSSQVQSDSANLYITSIF